MRWEVTDFQGDELILLKFYTEQPGYSPENGRGIRLRTSRGADDHCPSIGNEVREGPLRRCEANSAGLEVSWQSILAHSSTLSLFPRLTANIFENTGSHEDIPSRAGRC